MSATALKVTSHVGRDLLQSAALFQHEQMVVWEYVSNGLEYIDLGVQPVVGVTVDLRGHKIVVRDNGRGMDIEDLKRYFKMHGENSDRKKGKAGRGMFGTGKSAAFGIADVLRLTTHKNGKRSKVQLERKDIEAAADGDEIPIQVLESETPTREKNGTLVEIEGIHLKKMDVPSIIRHVERHIAHWPNANVFVNKVPCKVEEPSYSREHRFSTKGTDFEAVLGDAELVVKVAKAPLEPEWQGIAIMSKGVWHTLTLAGCENKYLSNYIFGEFDVARLAEDKSPISAFDMSRSMRLNPKNEVVANIFAFVGSKIEGVRRELEKDDRERKRARDAQRLQEEADAIAKIINKDFEAWRDQVKKALAKVAGGSDKLEKAAVAEEPGETLVPGVDMPAIIVGDDGFKDADFEPNPCSDPNPDPGPIPDEPAPALAPGPENSETKAKPRNRNNTGSSGGFRVDFREMGVEAARAKYERNERTIYINLDHPQIAAARSTGSIDDPTFRRLSYEVAFSEYAIAFASERAGCNFYIDVTEPIYDIRDTLNRLSRSAAGLYSKDRDWS
jgi:anti-sigma regulatory factor (Ser/Thr protein kinase)